MIDLFEAKDEKQFDNKIFNTQLNFDGEIYLSKIFMSYLILIINDKKKIIKYINDIKIINDIVLTVINVNSGYKIQNKDMLYNYKKDIKEQSEFL